jgi:hypothetical protein
MLKNGYLSKADLPRMIFFELPKKIFNNRSYNVVTDVLIEISTFRTWPCKLCG